MYYNTQHVKELCLTPGNAENDKESTFSDNAGVYYRPNYRSMTLRAPHVIPDERDQCQRAGYGRWRQYNKKLSYPQRKRASNMTLLYGAKGMLVSNPHGSRVWQYSSAICRMNINAKLGTWKAAALSTACDLSLTHSFGDEPLNTGPRNLASRN